MRLETMFDLYLIFCYQLKLLPIDILYCLTMFSIGVPRIFDWGANFNLSSERQSFWEQTTTAIKMVDITFYVLGKAKNAYFLSGRLLCLVWKTSANWSVSKRILNLYIKPDENT